MDPDATIRLSFPDDEAIGSRIGRYKLLQKIGEGGMGVVYMAEQEEPVRRRIALKIIKLGMDTKQVVARFEAERQALALMDHPNIARVLDGGATEAGRPYFVMELVQGVPITEFCDKNKLPARERLKLFIPICQAIQSAHQKGIIHRDLKPSNVLVTLNHGEPQAKVIDFGIAKAVSQKLTEKTVFTNYGTMIGTPAYMSPEQAEMSSLDVDTRTDVYSLGVLLYELLTGSTPFSEKRLLSLGYGEMQRVIMEEEPERPSTRLSTMDQEHKTVVMKNRGEQGESLRNLLKGDLDWIAMKCLEKDRRRRYETANGLARDIERYMANEPVTARPPSAGYRFQKAWQRNRVAFTSGIIVVAALVLGIAATSWQALRALRAEKQEAALREQAEASAGKAREAQSSEAQMRARAEEQARVERQRAYASDMNLAQQELRVNNIGRALALLNQYRPKAGQEDLRGWEWRYLWQFCKSDAVKTFGPLNEPGLSLAVSPEGRWICTAGLFSHHCRVWDTEAGKEIELTGSNIQTFRLAYCPKQRLLALGALEQQGTNREYSIEFWDLENKQVVRSIPLEGAPRQLAVSGDGETILAPFVSKKSRDEARVLLWRTEDGKLLSDFTISGTYVGGYEDKVALSWDGKLVAHAVDPDRIRLVDAATGKEIWTTESLGNTIVESLAFSPDGKSLVSGEGYSASDIKIWSVATGRQIGKLEGHRSWIATFVFWPDGKTLASASADQTIRLWDFAARQPLGVLNGHQSEVWRLALLPDGRTLFSGAKDGVLAKWDTKREQRQKQAVSLPGKVFAWSFSADSRSITSVDGEGNVSRWHGRDFQEGEDIAHVEGKANIAGGGRFVVVEEGDGLFGIWDVETHKREREFHTEASFHALKCVPGAPEIVAGWVRTNGEVCGIWNFMTGNPVTRWTNEPESYVVAVSAGGKLALSLGDDHSATIRDLATGTQRTAHLHFEQIDAVEFAPNDEAFVIATEPGVARFWNAATLQELATVKGHLLSVHSVAFTADSKRFATGSTGNEAVKIWDYAGKRDLITLEAQDPERLRETKFSPDGNTLAALSYNGVLHIWQAPSWREITEEEAKAKAESPAE